MPSTLDAASTSLRVCRVGSGIARKRPPEIGSRPMPMWWSRLLWRSVTEPEAGDPSTGQERSDQLGPHGDAFSPIAHECDLAAVDRELGHVREIAEQVQGLDLVAKVEVIRGLVQQQHDGVLGQAAR